MGATSKSDEKAYSVPLTAKIGLYIWDLYPNLNLFETNLKLSLSVALTSQIGL